MKKIIGIILIMIALCFPIMIEAKTQNGFYADDEVELNEEIDATAFVAGNNIEVNSKINGLNFVAGNNIELSSTQDYLFTAGNNIEVNKVNTKDAFIAGSTIRIKESNIRDLYVAGSTIKINSNIERNAYIGGEKVTIDGTIGGNVIIDANTIIIEKDTIISGTLKYPDNAKITLAESATIKKIKAYEVKSKETIVTWKTTLKEKLYGYLSLLVIAFILITLHHKLLKGIKGIKKEISQVLKLSGIGFLVLVVTPIVVVLSMISIIGLPLGIIVAMLYGILMYISMIPTAIYLGSWVMNKKNQNDYLVLAISLLIIYMIRIIPIIGGIIGFISIILGLGIYYYNFINIYKEGKK